MGLLDSAEALEPHMNLQGEWLLAQTCAGVCCLAPPPQERAGCVCSPLAASNEGWAWGPLSWAHPEVASIPRGTAHPPSVQSDE